ncbi:TFIIF-interacting CTD phosphatase, including NLI-interacting factor (involved in RNA polymerase II regulation) [Plasmopara halstedii]|uniref:TFIIF-interacting CTD phosphatase, including NLI-interacting factor (Involved in RNA polymerase II regulation) n=1 Tax=Plasmopara halstedii TaxID=4781 RepID=A0A0P1B7F9_PLAHL|nr:TFIIF-interacting CTD phosphatase, including NLI-interacting factor (involved in RNA polymerase II regulation) [Plasmopara halstedii]CEG50492.1 TFIIF-interacting CTD phosphatase, including NLI-interacting factor (involved in RNA polymerase II regulation) [Plasmopara halstedii]|eukprot:XP_024586861.1 TFIIF-interacting CTD phosphatase, including NLI-interacting factor (involved in RNA polymerase II regulation) [Plasmopara halstedii]
MQNKQENQQTVVNVSPKPNATKTSSRLLHNAAFSRRNTDDMTMSSQPKPLANLNFTSPLSHIIHQTDKDGIWSALVVKEQIQRPTPTKHKAKTIGTTIELRMSIMPPQSPEDLSKKCLVLDLDETLVHSSFEPISNPDFIISYDLDQVYVCKRPGVEEFLNTMSKIYEIVVYTASLSKYADPLLDKLDAEGVIRYRLYREHCVQYEGSYVKDLSLLDRDISQTIIVDDTPMAYTFHPQNAIGCSSFFDDRDDCELESILTFLTTIQDVNDVRDHLPRLFN